MKQFLILIFYFSSFIFSSFAQQNKIDSLKKELLKIKEDTDKVNLLNRISYQLRFNQPDSALTYAKDALNLSEKLKFNKGKSDAYFNFGNAYNYKSNFTEAKNFHSKALALRQKLNDKKGIANSYNGIGRIYSNQGLLKEAVENYLNALRIFEEIKDTSGMAYTNVYLGVVYLKQEKFDEALKYYSTAMPLFEAVNDTRGRHSAYSSIGYIYEQTGNYSQALEFNFKCLQLYTRDGDKDGMANICSNIGSLKANIKDFEQAVDYGKQGIKLYEELGDKDGLSWAFNNLGTTYRKEGDYKNAIQNFDKGLSAAKEAHIIDEIKNAAQNLSEIYAAMQKFKEAFEYHQLFSQMKDSLFNEESQKQITEMQTKYDTEKKEQQIKLLNKDKEIQTKDLERQKTIRNAVAGGLVLVLLFSFVLINRLLLIRKQKKIIEIEREKSEKLLLNILPKEIAEELKVSRATALSGGTAMPVKPKKYEMVTVMFTDFKGFTTIAEKMSAEELVSELDFIFKKFDEIISKYPIEKIKTIGDAYMCAGGLPIANRTNPVDVVMAGLEIQEWMKSQNKWKLRLGIHTGSVIAGVVGDKKFAYDIWGDTVNTASRMESSGEAGKVNISGEIYKMLVGTRHAVSLQFTFRGKIPAKNKGEIEMYFVERK